MSLRFTNDSANVVDLARPHSNLATQLQELSNAYGNFIEIARDEDDLESDVKLWLRFWDFISILQDIHQRQAQAASL